MDQTMKFLSIERLGGGLSPSASPVTRFTFDDDWRPLTKPSSLKKQKIGLTTPSKDKKHVRFSQINQKFFYPVSQLYYLDAWPSSLKLLSPAHMLLLLLSSLSLAVAGCVAYPLGFRTGALLLWLLSFLIVSCLVVLSTAIMVKKGSNGGFGMIKTRV